MGQIWWEKLQVREKWNIFIAVTWIWFRNADCFLIRVDPDSLDYWK